MTASPTSTSIRYRPAFCFEVRKGIRKGAPFISVVTATATKRPSASNRLRRKRWFRSMKNCKAIVSLSR